MQNSGCVFFCAQHTFVSQTFCLFNRCFVFSFFNTIYTLSRVGFISTVQVHASCLLQSYRQVARHEQRKDRNSNNNNIVVFGISQKVDVFIIATMSTACTQILAAVVVKTIFHVRSRKKRRKKKAQSYDRTEHEGWNNGTEPTEANVYGVLCYCFYFIYSYFYSYFVFSIWKWTRKHAHSSTYRISRNKHVHGVTVISKTARKRHLTLSHDCCGHVRIFRRAVTKSPGTMSGDTYRETRTNAWRKLEARKYGQREREREKENLLAAAMRVCEQTVRREAPDE